MLIRSMRDARPLIAQAGAATEQGELGFEWDIILPA